MLDNSALDLKHKLLIEKIKAVNFKEARIKNKVFKLFLFNFCLNFRFTG